MRGVGHANPVAHGAAAGGNSTPFHNMCRDCDRKVRSEERGRSARPAATPKHQLLDKVAEKPRPSRPPDGVIMKDKQTGELPPFGENKAQQKVQKKDFGNVDQNQEIRLRGKLKWLFEQDRMFWESNSAKSSRRGSPECDRSRSLNSLSTTAKPAVVDSPNDAKLVHVVEESFRRVCSSRKPPVNKLKPPRQQPEQETTDKAVVSRGEGLSTKRHSSPAKVPWTFSTSTAKFWPRGRSKAQNSANAPNAESEARVLAARHSSVGHSKRTKANEDPTLPHSSLEEILTDYEDAPKSGESSETVTSDEDEVSRKKVDVIIAERGDRSLKDVKDQAAYLKAKCDILAKEKDHALRKWKRSCQEMDDATKMAQALRTAIETLLEASASDSRADFKARQEILEDQTRALQLRMENLRRKNSEGLQRQPEVKTPIIPLEDRAETLKKTSEGRSLATPDIPRDTEYKVEALRARLEKLMLATNSRISDEQREPLRSAREEKKKPVENWLHQKSHRDEKTELKMKGWLDSLSAELTSDESPGTSSTGVCEKFNGAGGFICSEMHTSGTPSGFTSKQATPSTSKQESPWSSTHDRERECPGSATSSEETKKNVIHKIAEEVRMETEQWFQVQDLLARVGDDMKSLQEACSTWERRAILAEAQVVNMQQEGPDQKEKTLHLGDEKLAELQNEMLKLRETVDEVKKQIGSIKIDPNGWFDAAHRFGYAFMPVNLHSSDASSGFKGDLKLFSCDNSTPDSSDQRRQGSSAFTAGLSQPSASALTAASTISSSEKTHAEHEMRQRSQIPSQQWAKEIARAEEDEILIAADASGPVFMLEFPNSTSKEMSSATDGNLLEKPAKIFQEELGLESSDSRDVVLQLQASTRERCTTFLQHEQISRYANLTASRRSPLKDVLENITSSKENKRPN